MIVGRCLKSRSYEIILSSFDSEFRDCQYQILMAGVSMFYPGMTSGGQQQSMAGPKILSRTSVLVAFEY